MNVFELTTSLMNIPSTSGEEEAVGHWLHDHLQSLGWTVELQKVSDNQNNVIAWLNDSPPRLVLDAPRHRAAIHSTDRG
jgi:acetylornithine deacetylase